MTRCLSVVWSACLMAAVAAAPGGDDAKPDADRLVQQLGAAKHADREAAAKALDALGPAALSALRDGAKSSDPEVRRRAGELLAKLDRQSESAAALAPTSVHLKAENAPLADVIRDLSRQAKMRLVVAREPVDLPTRRVTLDTGATGVWEALDALCRTAKVSIRPGTLDPTTDEAGPAGGANRVVPAGVPLPAAAPNAAGGPVVATMIANPMMPADEPLVLQDGVLPTCPTAILGAVRVRLIPDRWVNRDRKSGEEVRWTLEVLTEPKVRWNGRPGFRFVAVPGLRMDAAPQGGGDPAGGARNIIMGGSSGMRTMGGNPLRGPSRFDLPVYVKADAGIGPTIAALTGSLAGTVQAPPGAVLTVADVTKEKASAAMRDGTTVTIREYQRADDGTVTLTVDVERPAGAVNIGNLANKQIRMAGAALPANIARLLNTPEVSYESFQLADDRGRPYAVNLTRAEVSQQGGTLKATFALTGRPADATAQARKLELHGPRQMTVDAAFTVRNVPVP